MKKFRKFVSRFFKLLPAIVREKFTRKFFFVDLNLLDDYEISLAVEYDEIVEAMSLVQTCYKQVELASNEALIRADYHNLLPSSYVFVAKDRKTGRIVGTISFIHRSCLGIPIEAQWDLESYLDQLNGIPAEISAVAIDPELRKIGKGLFSLLAISSLKFCYEKFNTDHFVMAVREDISFLYEDIFRFDRIGRPMNYSKANGSFGVPMHLHFSHKLAKLEKKDRNLDVNRSIYKLIYSDVLKINERGSELIPGVVTQLFLHPEQIERIASNAGGILENTRLSILRKMNSMFYDLYFTSKKYGFDVRRTNPRFLVNLEAQLRLEAETVTLNSIAKGGVGFKTDREFATGEVIELEVELGSRFVLSGIVAWANNGNYGVQFTSYTENWEALIEKCESNLPREKDDQPIKIAA